MLKAVHKLLSEADAVVTFNGNKYDLPKLNGEFVRYGFIPPAPPTSIDLLDTVKKFGLFMNRLAFVGPFFAIGKKIAHEGFSLWTKVMDGDGAAQKRMARYCKGDIRLTEQLYKKILPYITNHPHLGTLSRGACGACQSLSMYARGFRRTKSFRIQRLQCKHCGAWQDGTRVKVK